MILSCYGQIFEKSSNIKFHETPSSGNLVVPCGQVDGQTDRHDGTDSHFCNFANEPNNCTTPLNSMQSADSNVTKAQMDALFCSLVINIYSYTF